MIYIAYDPSYRYGTRLVLYDDGRRELQIERPGETDVREL